MLRLLLISLLAALAVTPAHAEKFRDADLKTLTGQIRTGCMKPSDKMSWMTTQQQSSACSCLAKRMEASLRKTDFVNTRAPTPPDKKKYMDFQNAASTACMQPAFKAQTARKVSQECLGQTGTLPVLKGLSKQRVNKTCGCVADRYARTWTIDLVSKLPDAAATREASRVLFAESIALCTKK